MEKESSDHDDVKILCEVPVLLAKTDDSKIDNDMERSDLNETWNEEDVVIISEVFSDCYDVEDMDLEDVVSEEKNDDVPVSVEKDSIDVITINEVTPGTSGNNCEIEVSNKKSEKPRQENDFVSEDAKENSDNFDVKWNYLKSLSAKEDKYEFIRKRWGNSVIPDPSIDLTYRHRNNPSLNRENWKRTIDHQSEEEKKKKKKKSMGRSLSCVSHMEKLMNDIKCNYNNELRKLCERHSLIMSEMQRHHQSEFISLFQHSFQNFYGKPETTQLLFLKQKQDEMVAVDKYQRQIQELVNKTSSNLARYKKYSEEILLFHKQYEINGSGLLKSEQLLHLQETERMYKEYEKFYS